jgi:cellulose biosynthesis protein BcsQ
MAREQTSVSRQIQASNRFKYIIIVAEGEKQEPNYFNALKDYLKITFQDSRIELMITKRPEEKYHHSAPNHLIKLAQEQAKKHECLDYDEIWIVFDKDSWNEAVFDALQDWKNQQSYHYLAYSNPSFDLWLILHFECQTIKKQLEPVEVRERSRLCKKIHSELKQEYRLSGDYSQYMIKLPNAIENAKNLDIAPNNDFPRNICTRVYRLIESLQTLPQKNLIFNPENCHNEHEVSSKFIIGYLLPLLGYQATDWRQERAYNKIRLDFSLNQLVIEAKSPKSYLDTSHTQQLFKYMQTLDLRYGMLTNGKELRIYEQANQKITLIFRCFVQGIESKIAAIKNLVGRETLNKPVKNVLQSNIEVHDMKIIGIYHNKGGVGKTTVSVNLAAALRNMGKRILLIDIDAQANATFATGLAKFIFDEEDDLKGANVFNLLEDADEGLIPELRHPSKDFNAPEIDVIPSHITLIDKQSRITAFLNTRFRLYKKLQKVKDEYDIVIIDAPPSRDIYAEITLITADYLLIPSDLKPFANQGLPNVRDFIRQVDETRISIGKEPLKVIGVLPSKISSNARYLQHTFEKQKQHVIDKYDFSVMESRIIDRKPLADCFSLELPVGDLMIPDPKSIFMFDKGEDSREEFNQLAYEILEKIGEKS